MVAYPDANGYSIGWGHHGSDVTKGMKINQATADSYFEKDIKAELDDPDGSKAVMEEAIATLEEKKRYLEYKESEADR